MEEKKYEIAAEFHRLSHRMPLALYKPTERSPRSEVAVFAMHMGDYMSFGPMMEMAKRGYLAAGAMPAGRDVKGLMESVNIAVNFLKSIPGVKKVVLMGHSQGGCIMSAYQYMAENGTKRFTDTKRIVPFPEIGPLTPADGIMLLDANYGIMDVLAMDPAVTLTNGYVRNPELDIYNPENGYNPAGSRYDREFVSRFQKAQIHFYEELLAMAQQKAEDIRLGKGMFADDEPIVIPGAGGGSNSNKLFIQDNSLLGHTRNPQPLLHKGGVITNEVICTDRVMEDAPSSTLYHRGANETTVQNLLAGEMKFDDFGYDECSMWGADWEFNPMSTRANVRGIHVPILLEGNTASHEFINTEYNYENAASADKTSIFLTGSTHMFEPEKRTEKYEGEFGDPLTTFSDFAADWLAGEGRFLS